MNYNTWIIPLEALTYLNFEHEHEHESMFMLSEVSCALILKCSCNYSHVLHDHDPMLIQSHSY